MSNFRSLLVMSPGAGNCLAFVFSIAHHIVIFVSAVWAECPLLAAWVCNHDESGVRKWMLPSEERGTDEQVLGFPSNRVNGRR